MEFADAANVDKDLVKMSLYSLSDIVFLGVVCFVAGVVVGTWGVILAQKLIGKPGGK